MPTCFVIQPFDSENDRRYEEVYKPALEQAGLDPYRVDQDPAVEVPIKDIERRIRDSVICLADITEDNPNVWYELGYAFAADTPVVMTCADKRTAKLPFDIQHRTVIRYATASPSDFERLRNDVTKRVKARVRHAESVQQLAEEQVAPQEGASQVEVMVLAVAAANMAPGFSAPMDHVQKDAERAGLTRAGYHVAVRRLMRKRFLTIEDVTRENLDGDWTEQHIKLCNDAWDWIDNNASLFSFIKRDDAILREEDIPF